MGARWQGQVYGKKAKKTDWDFWNRLKEYIIQRDHFRCQGCFKRKVPKGFTVHHINPRANGGNDDLDNLITLCFECHDIVEEMNLRTAEEIRGFNTAEKHHQDPTVYNRVCSEEIEFMLKRIDTHRPNWHAKVYGGMKSK